MTNNNVIFLDFDGPLYPEKVLDYSENQDNPDVLQELQIHPFYKYWKADYFCVELLNRLWKLFSVQCVVSSSWADDRMHNRGTISKLFYKNGILMPLHDDWRTPRADSKDRCVQISQWILKNSPDKYCILDDTSSGRDLILPADTLLAMSIFPNSIVFVDEKEGLDISTASAVYQIFSKE